MRSVEEEREAWAKIEEWKRLVPPDSVDGRAIAAVERLRGVANQLRAIHGPRPTFTLIQGGKSDEGGGDA